MSVTKEYGITILFIYFCLNWYLKMTKVTCIIHTSCRVSSSSRAGSSSHTEHAPSWASWSSRKSPSRVRTLGRLLSECTISCRLRFMGSIEWWEECWGLCFLGRWLLLMREGKQRVWYLLGCGFLGPLWLGVRLLLVYVGFGICG